MIGGRTTGVALTQVALLWQVALLEAGEAAGAENIIRIGVSIRGLAMRVIIMRHGDAVFQGAERVLSSRGEQEARLTGLKLVSAFNITKIFCSSKRRAQQTAQIVHGLMRGCNVPEVQGLNELNPYGDASLVRDYLDAVCDPDDTVLLISHIPQVVNLSWTFCQQEIELPTFFTAGALVLEPRKKAIKAASSTFTSYCPCLFLAPNRELRLSSTPETAAAASAAHAVTSSANSHLVSSTISPLHTVPFASAPFAAACSVESHSEDVTTPDEPLNADPLRECAALLIPSAQFYSAPTTADFAQSSAPEHSQSVEYPTLMPSAHESEGAVTGKHLHTAAATAAAAAAVAASALVVPAVKLSENGSLPLAVAVAAATIPAAVRKAQVASSVTANQGQNEPKDTISAGAVHNRHSQRMLSLLSTAHA